jgi:hypothetical protein
MHIRAFQKEERTLSDGQKRRAKMLTHTFYRCPFGSNRSKAGKQRAAEGITVAHAAATASQHAETKKRIGKVSRGRSIRSCDCGFSMKVVVFAATPERAYIWLFNQGMHSKVGETEPCHGPESAGHAAFLGAPTISPSLKEIVKQSLRDGLTPARIIASTPHPHTCTGHMCSCQSLQTCEGVAITTQTLSVVA